MLICAKRKEYITVRFSDPGRLRPTNEDAFLADRETGLFAVADGMGGHAAGEVASHLAIEALRAGGSPPAAEPGSADADPASIARKWLASLVEAANRVVFEAARANPEYRGMGTTLTALYLRSPVACYAHVGDSRLYRFRDGRLQQLTRDHTWVREQVDSGLLSPAEADRHPYRSVLTRAIGTNESVEVDSSEVDVQTSDLFLLCSDGLTTMLDDDDIAGVLSRGLSLEESTAVLIDEANRRGGYDNITVVLVAAEI